MTVVAGVATRAAGVALFPRILPDVTLMELELPGMSGVDAIRAIRTQFAEARIVVLTVHDGNEDIFRSLKSGATTYLLKDTLTKDLIRVIRQVHAGERPIPP